MREVDGVRVLYDRRSGQTHFLAPDLAAVLDALGDAPGDAAAVLAALSRTHATEVESGEVIDAVGARLAELAGLALIDPIR